METLKLVRLDWISQERDKYIWEDLYEYSWDEIIGRMYLLKVHAQAANGHYEAALLDLEQALSPYATSIENLFSPHRDSWYGVCR